MQTDLLTNDGIKHSAERHKKLRFLTLFLISFLLFFQSGIFPFWTIVRAAETPERPKIGLVLGGGGAKGSAHIGVLKVLEELRIPVDYIAGTSMGAIVGSLYASGLSPGEIEKILTTVDWNDLFSGDPDRKDIDFWRKREDFLFLAPLTLGVRDGKILLPKGLVKDQKINVLFETLLLHTSEIKDFDRLPIPYRAVATDIETGEMVILKSGRLADAARASMSVPGAFPPVELDDRILIDGGIVRNLPVDIVRDLGAGVIICVDVGKPLLTREELAGPLEILNQMLDIMMMKNVQEQIDSLGPQDVYINPDLGDLESGDFSRGAEGSRMGEAAARNNIDSLQRYSVPVREYAVFLERQRRERVREMKIVDMQVDVEGKNKIAPEVVAERFGVEEGDTVDIKTLAQGADNVFGMADFDRVDILMNKHEEKGYDLLLRTRENAIGPNYLRFGMALESDFDGVSRYGILLDYTRRWVNSFGAEWKTLINIGSPFGMYTEFYQPLTPSRFFFVMPHAKWSKRQVSLYEDNDRIAEYSVSGYNFGLDVGIQPRMYGIARIGVLFGNDEASLETGDSQQLPAEESFERRGITYGILVDQMDNLNFPNSGYAARIGVFSSLEALGADDNYNRIEGTVAGAHTFKRQTVFAQLKAGSQFGGELPFNEELELGGFLNLSGLQQNQLRGNYMALAQLVSYHKVAKSFFGDLYLGGSLETGNIWEEEYDFSDLRFAGSLFIGYDTILGPFYIGLGLIDQGECAGYFYLGRTF